MKYKTCELEGALLDAAVAKALGYNLGRTDSFGAGYSGPAWIHLGPFPAIPKAVFNPSTDWAQGGPIIERERISLDFVGADLVGAEWLATVASDESAFGSGRAGATPLIAAMRVYVASKFGEEVDL